MSPLLVGLTCFAIAVLIMVWDGYLYSDDVERNSITQVVIDATKKTPTVPWLIGLGMGYLGGHFFG